LEVALEDPTFMVALAQLVDQVADHWVTVAAEIMDKVRPVKVIEVVQETMFQLAEMYQVVVVAALAQWAAMVHIMVGQAALVEQVYKAVSLELHFITPVVAVDKVQLAALVEVVVAQELLTLVAVVVVVMQAVPEW